MHCTLEKEEEQELQLCGRAGLLLHEQDTVIAENYQFIMKKHSHNHRTWLHQQDNDVPLKTYVERAEAFGKCHPTSLREDKKCAEHR